MKSEKNMFIVICFFGLLGLGLVGCQSSESNSNEESDKVTLELWNNVAAGRSYFPILIEEFEKENPNIEIELNNLNVESSEAEYQAAISDESLPDIFSTDALTINEFVNLDLVRELDELFPADVRDEYNQGVFDEGNASLNGHVYLFPVYKGGTYYMFYNKQVLNDLGVSKTPTTWEELNEVGQEIYNKSDGATYGLIFGGQSGWLVEAITKLFATELSPESDYDYKNGDYKYATEGYIETMKYMKELRENKVLSLSTLETDSTVARELFVSGQAAFLIDGNWTGQLLNESGFKDWGVLKLPTKDQNGKQYGEFGLGSNDGLYVAKDTKHWNEVKKFMEFLRENMYEEILRDGEPIVAKKISNFDIDLPFEQMTEISDIFDEMNVRTPDPIVVNSEAQVIEVETQKNAPDAAPGSILMGYLTGQVEDVESELKKYEEGYNQAFKDALEDNENITQEDFKFPNWVPYEPYTSEDYKELN
ncbi:extracellular solute-binding protein [Bacillaceae bacterium SIJ1]|uniref:ABC transporter substrate-binding protein n=1 Tax=Litoribacterium kuwaitense TaxID=1398745 RepID=UPI0013ED7ACD|nr:extracellular solute-binding protein [Litoribacterium kuwaitense]NGP45166.1 extracellular solute-binding protein [Litoribacterium kuwaitense]